MSTKKILYVEDNDDNVYMLKPRLERKGYEVLIAGDGKEGIYLANNKNPDLILMDLQLPVLDGWEATRHLKKDPNTKHIPIIALSALALEEDRSRAIAAGCDDFDSKPVDFDSLITKIQSLLPGESEQIIEKKVAVQDQSKILIADDNDDNRYTLSQYLKREGYTNLEMAENGKIALDKLKDNDYDLVLLDLNMPEMDGIEALRHIKSDDKLKHIPVVMISAADEIENVTQCIEIGAEGFLPKPFNSMILRARINASLGKKRLHAQESAKNVEKGKEQADQLRIANELIATKCARTYFRICLFIPLLVPLPFLVFKGDEGLSSLFIGSLVFAMPPYVLALLLPFVFLFGRMTEKQIVIGVIFFPVFYPLIFGLFWSVIPNFIHTSVTITLSNPSQWIFTAVVIPAAYSILFLSGYIIRRKLIIWDT
jgi:CheY-like chemotaxis protein